MGKKKKADSSSSTEPIIAGDSVAFAQPSARSLVVLVGLGTLSALWALFLWAQLLVARAGGQPFCGFSESASCGALWDGAFASGVHAATKIPVAGWGLIWGLVAIALPVLGLWRRAEGKDAGAFVTATKLTSIAGLLSVVALLLVSMTSGALCFLCVGTYVVVTGYSLVALIGWRALGFPDMPKAVQVTVGAVVASFVVLLYPGASTPKNAEKAAADAMRAATARDDGPVRDPHGEPPPKQPHEPPPFARGEGTGDPSRDLEVERFVGSLPPEVQGMLSSSLGQWHASTAVVERPPARSVWGPPDAPVKIVEWTDALCGHCAQMHETLEEISRVAPPNTFSVEPRHFPLDAACNPHVQRKNPAGPVSCVAASAQICVEGKDNAHELTGELFKSQRALTSVDAVYGIASKYMPLAELKACVESAATKQKLDDDLAFALTLDPEGTPIVLVNGKKGNGFGAFLYAMIMTKGSGEHPSFKALPAPDVNAHIH